MLLSRNSSCCTPNVQVMTFGDTWFGISDCVAARASARVTGGTFTCNNPPNCRKPCPAAGLVGLAGLKFVHHWGAAASAQVSPGICSDCNCGGKLLIAKLFGLTSYARPAPPRTAHFPFPRGSQAKPSLGAKLLMSGFGARKNSPIAGSSETALMACKFSSRGTPLYS